MRQKFMERFDTDGDYFVSRDEFLRGVNQPYPSYDSDWMVSIFVLYSSKFLILIVINFSLLLHVFADTNAFKHIFRLVFFV